MIDNFTMVCDESYSGEIESVRIRYMSHTVVKLNAYEYVLQ